MSEQSTINCRVRLMSEPDLEIVRAWRNHPRVRDYMFTRDEISAEAHRAWYNQCRADPKKHLLVYEADGAIQGFISFVESKAGQLADWGFYASPEASKGTGRRLARVALDYAFNEIGLHKVSGQVLAYNERSVRLHQFMGFRQEGVLRDHHYDGHRYIDVVCFGLLSPEWGDKQKENQEK